MFAGVVVVLFGVVFPKLSSLLSVEADFGYRALVFLYGGNPRGNPRGATLEGSWATLGRRWGGLWGLFWRLRRTLGANS